MWFGVLGEIVDELNEIEQILNHVENHINDEKANIESKIELLYICKHDRDIQDADFLADSLKEELFLYSGIFRNNIYKSLFISACSIFEYKLQEMVANYLVNTRAIKLSDLLSFREQKNKCDILLDIIKNYKKNLTTKKQKHICFLVEFLNEHEIEIDPSSKECSIIYELYNIRNDIVHNGGFLKYDTQSNLTIIKEEIENIEMLKRNIYHLQDSKIIIGKNGVLLFCHLIRKLFLKQELNNSLFLPFNLDG